MNFRKLVSRTLIIVLVAVLAIVAVGCGKDNNESNKKDSIVMYQIQ